MNYISLYNLLFVLFILFNNTCLAYAAINKYEEVNT